MDRAQLQKHLAQADRHMAELKARIGRRRLILGRTLTECRRLLVAKSTLQALEGSLHKFGEHCEHNLDNPPKPVVIYDDLPKDEAHGWKFLPKCAIKSRVLYKV